MSETKNTPPIAPVDEGVIAAMRRASAMTLPDDPSACGMKAGEIRRRFWESIFGRVSLLSELQRVIGEVNVSLLEVDGRSVYEYALEAGFTGTEAEFKEAFAKALRGDYGGGECLLPEVSDADEGKILAVVGGKWTAAEAGTSAPSPVYTGEVEVV